MRRFGGRYLLEEPIGDGPNGVVWWGQTAERTPVAVKVLRPELSADASVAAGLAAERELLTSIASPHLVAVHDILVSDGELGLVMDLIDGPSLRAELAALGTLAPSHALVLIADVLAGVTALHAAGVAHGDLKTADILIDQDGVARVTDFGLGSLRGGAGAMWGAADDVHAAGAVLYELMFGAPPVSGSDAAGALRRHLEQLPVLSTKLPEASCTVLASMLDPDPALRPSAFVAAVVAAEVAGQIADEPSPDAAVPLSNAELPTDPEPTAQWSPFTDILDTAAVPAADVSDTGPLEAPVVGPSAEPAGEPEAATVVGVAALETDAFAAVDQPGANELTGPLQPVPGGLFDDSPPELYTEGPVYAEFDERPRRKLMMVAAGLVAVIVLGGGAVYTLTSSDSRGAAGQSGTTIEGTPGAQTSADGSASNKGVSKTPGGSSTRSSAGPSVSAAPSGGASAVDVKAGTAQTSGSTTSDGSSASAGSASTSSGQTSAAGGSSSDPNLSPSQAVVSAQPSGAPTSDGGAPVSVSNPGPSDTSSSGSASAPSSAPPSSNTPPSSGAGTSSTPPSSAPPSSSGPSSIAPPSSSDPSTSTSTSAVSTPSTASTPPTVTSSSVAPPSTSGSVSTSASASISVLPS